MRPTDIKLKTPRDRTPGPKCMFTVTSSGKDLSYSKVFKDKKSFSTEKRFKYYNQLFQRTETSVGPGSYITDQFSFIKNSLKRSTIKYRPTLKKYNSSKKNFYMVGNLLINDETLDDRRKIKQKKKSRSVTNIQKPHSLHDNYLKEYLKMHLVK